MTEYVFRYAPGYGCDMNDMMDGGRVTVGDYFASDATDHYGTLHEEIVRCRDCKHFTYADSEHDNNDWCAKHEHIAWSVNGFCAWACRKEGGE